MGYSLQHRFHSRSKRAAVPSEGPGVKAGVGEDEMGVVGGVGSCLVHWTFDVDVLRVCFSSSTIRLCDGDGEWACCCINFWQAIHFFEDFLWLTWQQENCLLDATDGCPMGCFQMEFDEIPIFHSNTSNILS